MNIINKLSTTALALGLLAAAMIFGSGCSKQAGEDVFDKSPAERVDARSNELAERLVASPNGWIMEYIPSKKSDYGGYIIGFKFNDKGQVLISSEALENTQAGATEPIHPAIKSSYSIGRDTGVTLNFPDYNEALHYYSTPDRRYAADLGKGYEGDYEFRYMASENPDELNFVGKKTGNKIRMYRATEDAIEYVKKIVEMKKKIFNAQRMFDNHQDALVASKPIMDKEDLTIYYPTTEGYNYYNGKVDEYSERNVKLRFFYTPTGLKFFEPGSDKIESYVWNEDSQTLEREGGVIIEARNDPHYDNYASYLGDYILRLDDNDGITDYDVRLEAAGRRNLYVLTGLPYQLFVTYNSKDNTFGIPVQIVDDQGTVLAAWGRRGGGNIVITGGYGLKSFLVPRSNPARYMMVDNGVWGECDSFILWIPDKGQGTHLTPSRLSYPMFIRK